MKSVLLNIPLLCCLYTLSVPVTTQANEYNSTGINIFGDLRFRFEQDWNSKTDSSLARNDRARARIRARLGIKITPNEVFDFTARLRSGNENSQQSPHITIKDFSGNDPGTRDAVFDIWYMKLKYDRLWIWGGRNSVPFWKQNELLWDDDATVIGTGAGIKNVALGPGKFSFNSGYVLLPDGMTETHGKMAVGQLLYTTIWHDINLTAAGSILALSDENTASTNLLQGNDLRNYTLWVANLQVKTDIAAIPVNFGFDYLHNSEDYSVIDLAGAPANTNDDDTEGYVLQIRLGRDENQGDYLVGYSYANIETFAVNSSYAQDDWMRWGSATQTRASDFNGHEFRIAYVLPWKWKVLARLYAVESNNTPEDGNRFRIDFNRKF